MRKLFLKIGAFSLLLACQVPNVFAEKNNPYELKFMKCFFDSDLSGMEQALKDGGYRIDIAPILYSVLIDRRKNQRLVLPVVQMLTRENPDLNSYFSYYYNSRIEVEDTYEHEFDYEDWRNILWIEGADGFNIQVSNYLMDAGTDPFPFAMGAAWGKDGFMARFKGNYLELLRSAIEHGADVNQADGNLLLTAIGHGDTAMVKLLVEAGAKVNHHTTWWAGSKKITPVEYAKEKSETDIYNYLIAHGAVDPNAPKVTQSAPSYYGSSGDNYSYSPPSQQNAPAPSRNTGAEIVQNLQKAFESPLDSGTYKMSGGSVELRFAGIAKSGVVSHKDVSGTTSNGSYSIDGSRLQINVLGRTWFYTINSKTSFSGHGETWYRSGY